MLKNGGGRMPTPRGLGNLPGRPGRENGGHLAQAHAPRRGFGKMPALPVDRASCRIQTRFDGGQSAL